MEDNKMKNFMKSDYGIEKVDKSEELNNSMTIKEKARDEYTSTIKNIGGGSND